MTEPLQLLVLLNVIQFAFWSFQVHRLVNKLMSRNFSEYNAAINPGDQPTRLVPIEQPGEPDQLTELNALING